MRWIAIILLVLFAAILLVAIFLRPFGDVWSTVTGGCSVLALLLSLAVLYAGEERVRRILGLSKPKPDAPQWPQFSTTHSATEIHRDGLIRLVRSGQDMPGISEIAALLETMRIYGVLTCHAHCCTEHIEHYLDGKVLLSVGDEGVPGPVAAMCRSLARAFSNDKPIDAVVYLDKPTNVLFADQLVRNMGGLGTKGGKPLSVRYDCQSHDGAICISPLTDYRSPVSERRVVVAEWMPIGGSELRHLVTHLVDRELANILGIAVLFDGSEPLSLELDASNRVERGGTVRLGRHRADRCGETSTPLAYGKY